MKKSFPIAYLADNLVSTCERLSVMHQQAKLPEIFDQILQNTPVLGFGSTATPPENKILPRESKSDLTQNTPPENWKL